MKILAIETSCDDTSAAVVKDGRYVLSSVINTQADEHRLYGGVVPEIASRRHIENISSVVKFALSEASADLEQIDAIAVTFAPGLIGAVLVGVNFAKGLAYSAGKPLIPVHHLRGHIAADYISHRELEPPFLALVVSGGHTELVRVEDYDRMSVVGATCDDAAGEALDKAARTLGISYPGGANMDKLCSAGDRYAYRFPQPRVDGRDHDMSFSGLKTSVINLINTLRNKGEKINVDDIGASYMHAVAGILTQKASDALDKTGMIKLALAGGVAANSYLRTYLSEMCAAKNVDLYLPELKYCSDNAAMIGAQAYYEKPLASDAILSLNAMATLDVGFIDIPNR